MLAAAADLFAHKGFHAVSAEAVADAADRTTGALYSHFGGKDGLLLELVQDWMQQSARRILARVEQAAELDDRLRALWTDSIIPDDQHGDGWLLLEFELWLHAARDAAFAGDLARHYAELRASLATALRRWADVDDAEAVAGQVIALLMGLAMQHRLDSAAVSTDDVVSGLRALLDHECPAPRR